MVSGLVVPCTHLASSTRFSIERLKICAECPELFVGQQSGNGQSLVNNQQHTSYSVLLILASDLRLRNGRICTTAVLNLRLGGVDDCD